MSNHFGQVRQKLVDHYFTQFIEAERAEQDAYHRFCKWAKDKSRLEIERELANKNGRGFWS